MTSPLHTDIDVAILTSMWGWHNRISYYSNDSEVLKMSNLASSIPGNYPLGYVAEHLHIHCACGRVSESLTLMTIERGPNNKPYLRRTGKSETIYDLSITHRDIIGGTAACLECVGNLKLEKVPNYDNRKNLRANLGALGPTMTHHLGLDEKKEPAKKYSSLSDLNV